MYEDAHCCSNYTPKSYMLPLCEQDGRRSPDANITNICVVFDSTTCTYQSYYRPYAQPWHGYCLLA